MNAWQPKGPLLNFTAASTAPTAVQVISLSGETGEVCKVDNTSSTVDVVIGWGGSSAEAIANASAAANVQNCAIVLHGTIQTFGIPANAYVTGKTASSTAVVYAQIGVEG